MVGFINQTTHIGQAAEATACQYLQARGLRLIEKNYSCYFGEIDLIMQDQVELVFVEVRYRREQAYGSAVQSVNRAKQKKLIKTAQHYLQAKNLYFKIANRFDILAIHPAHPKIEVQWVKNDFLVS
jgi:putative endonuclease